MIIRMNHKKEENDEQERKKERLSKKIRKIDMHYQPC